MPHPAPAHKSFSDRPRVRRASLARGRAHASAEWKCDELELSPLPSTGITRLQRYYEPLRHLAWPGLSLAGNRLADYAATK